DPQETQLVIVEAETDGCGLEDDVEQSAGRPLLRQLLADPEVDQEPEEQPAEQDDGGSERHPPAAECRDARYQCHGANPRRVGTGGGTCPVGNSGDGLSTNCHGVRTSGAQRPRRREWLPLPNSNGHAGADPPLRTPPAHVWRAARPGWREGGHSGTLPVLSVT